MSLVRLPDDRLATVPDYGAIREARGLLAASHTAPDFRIEPRHNNAPIAARLDEVAALLEAQGANAFRVEAYRRGARTLRALSRPAAEIVAREGFGGLDRLPGIGPALARAIFSIVCTGRLPLLERLRGETDPTTVLATIPGIGPLLADRLYHDLGIATLEELEVAAHDGRLERVPGLGRKRVAGIRDVLASRLSRARGGSPEAAAEPQPSTAELLDVDREYRERVAEGSLRRIAPRRFNPGKRAWLPILHTQRGDRHYTALYSNTARAHRLGRTRDWVVLYADGSAPERSWTVVTERSGERRGRRVVRGREAEATREPVSSVTSTSTAPAPGVGACAQEVRP